MKNKLLEVFNGNNTLKIHSATFYGETYLMCKVIIDGYFEPCRVYKQIINEKLKEIDPNSDITIDVIAGHWY